MDNLQPGQTLGPYRIINQIGKGGMATVYKAYQPSVDRYVAIKVLPSQTCGKQGVCNAISAGSAHHRQTGASAYFAGL